MRAAGDARFLTRNGRTHRADALIRDLISTFGRHDLSVEDLQGADHERRRMRQELGKIERAVAAARELLTLAGQTTDCTLGGGSARIRVSVYAAVADSTPSWCRVCLCVRVCVVVC